MASAGSIFVDLDLNGEKYKLGLTKAGQTGSAYVKKTEAEFKAMSDKISSNMKIAAGAVGAYFTAGAIKSGLVSITKAFAEQAESIHRLNMSLAVTGRYSEATSQHFQKLAVDVAQSTLATKGQVRAIESYFITFTNLKQDMQDKAVKAAIGLSAAMPDKSPEELAAAIGKGLMGNMKALQRMNLNFKDLGDPLKNQQQLLDALLPLYDWAINSTGTLAGQTAMLSKEWKTLQITMGETLLSFFDSIGALEDLKDAVKSVQDAIKGYNLERVENAKARIAENKMYLSGERNSTGQLVAKQGISGMFGIRSAVDEAAIKQQIAEDEALLDRLTKKNEFQPLPGSFTKAFNPQARPSAEAEAQEGKAKRAAEQYADIMASIGGKWLEATTGVDKHLEAVTKVNNEYDSYIKKLSDAGIGGAQMEAAKAAAESLRYYQLQNLELEKQQRLFEQMLEDSEKRAELETGFLNKLIQVGVEGKDLDAALAGLENYGSKESRQMYMDSFGKKDTGNALSSILSSISSSIGSVGRSGKGGIGIADMIMQSIGSVKGAIGQKEFVSSGTKSSDFLTAAGNVISGQSTDFYKNIKNVFTNPLKASAKELGQSFGAVASVASSFAMAYSSAQGMSKGAAAAMGVAQGAEAGSSGGWVGAILGGVAGGLGGLLGGGKKKQEGPTPEEQEADKLYRELKAMQYQGFMAPIVGKGYIESHLDAMREYTEQIKNLSKSISDTISGGLKAAFDSPTTQSAIDNFNDKFAKGFETIFLNEATATMEKVMKAIMAPAMQVLNDISFMLTNKWYEVMKPFYKELTALYKQISNLVGGAFDVLNMGLDFIIKRMPILGNTLATVIYGGLLMMIPDLYIALTDVFGAIGKLLEKMFEPIVKSINIIVLKFEKIFDIQPEWIEQMERAGIALENSMSSDTVKDMQSMWESFTGIIENAFRDGINAGSVQTGVEVFGRKFKEGLYKWMVEGIIKAFSASAVILAAIAPYIKQYVTLIRKAMQGKGVDMTELTKLFSDMATSTETFMNDNADLIKGIIALGQNARTDFFGGGTKTSNTGTATNIKEPEAQLTGWEQIWKRFSERMQYFGDVLNAVFTAWNKIMEDIRYSWFAFWDNILSWLEKVFHFTIDPLTGKPEFHGLILGAIQSVWNWVKDLWNYRWKKPDGEPGWLGKIYNTLVSVWNFIKGVWDWVVSPFTGEPPWKGKLTGIIDGFKTFCKGVWDWVVSPFTGDPPWKGKLTGWLKGFWEHIRNDSTGIFGWWNWTKKEDPLEPAWKGKLTGWLVNFWETIRNDDTGILGWKRDWTWVDPPWRQAMSLWLDNLWGSITSIWDYLGTIVKSMVKGTVWVLETLTQYDWNQDKFIGNPDKGIPAYARGTAYVPYTGLAMVHQGEAIIPADQNSYSASSRPVINVNISGVTIKENVDIRALAKTIGFYIEQETRVGAY